MTQTAYQITLAGLAEIRSIILAMHPQGNDILENPHLYLTYIAMAEANMDTQDEPFFELLYGTPELYCNYDYELSEDSMSLGYLH